MMGRIISEETKAIEAGQALPSAEVFLVTCFCGMHCEGPTGIFTTGELAQAHVEEKRKLHGPSLDYEVMRVRLNKAIGE